MHLLVAVEMNRPGEERARLVLVHPLFHQDGVRAEINELPPRDDAFHDFRELLVQERFAARDRNDGRAALVDGMKRRFDGHALFENFVGVIDLAAPRAGEVAAEQGLEHQHERIPCPAADALAEDITSDENFLEKRNTH